MKVIHWALADHPTQSLCGVTITRDQTPGVARRNPTCKVCLAMAPLDTRKARAGKGGYAN